MIVAISLLLFSAFYQIKSEDKDPQKAKKGAKKEKITPPKFRDEKNELRQTNDDDSGNALLRRRESKSESPKFKYLYLGRPQDIGVHPIASYTYPTPTLENLDISFEGEPSFATERAPPQKGRQAVPVPPPEEIHAGNKKESIDIPLPRPSKPVQFRFNLPIEHVGYTQTKADPEENVVASMFGIDPKIPILDKSAAITPPTILKAHGAPFSRKVIKRPIPPATVRFSNPSQGPT